MRKVILYIATSLNGMIARKDGSVDWLHELPNPENLDYGYHDMYAAIDTTIQGYQTYAQLKSWDIPFPYLEKQNFVFSRKKGLKDTNEVSFITEKHIEFVKALKLEKGKDIWLIGGAQINALLMRKGLIDRIELFIMPVILSNGIPLFGNADLGIDATYVLKESKTFSTGVVALKYLRS